MSLAALRDDEKEVVRRAMIATFDYFTFDFSARLGLEIEEMEELLARWPAIDDSADDSIECLAVNNSLNDLLHGEGISEETAKAKIGVERDEMLKIYKKWATARGWNSTGVR